MAEKIVAETRDDEVHNQLEGATIVRMHPISATSMQNTLDPLYEQRRIYEGRKVGISTKLFHRLGFEELASSQVWRASAAELLGTGALVFMLDSIVISSFETNTKTPNIMIACLVALTVAILQLATGPISGAHINPTITLSAAFVGLISFSRAIIYIIAQCIGAIFGALAFDVVASRSISKFSLGGCTLKVITPGPNGPRTFVIETGHALGLEVICTFIYLFPVWMGFDQRQYKALGPVVVRSIVGIMVGLIVFVSTTVTTKIGYSGAGINPARCIGPAVVRGGHLWTYQWVFWVGPGIACIAFYLYTVIIPRDHFKARFSMSKTV